MLRKALCGLLLAVSLTSCSGDEVAGGDDGRDAGPGPGLPDASPAPAASSTSPPTVTPPAAQTVRAGTEVVLTATADDADGDALSFSWQQTDGSPAVTLTDADSATARFTAPAEAGFATLVFEVTVCDPSAACEKASTQVTVDTPPSITTVTATPNPVGEGGLAALDVVATDAGDTLTYAWRQTAGAVGQLTAADQSRAQFAAPGVAQASTATFEIKVCDRFQLCATSGVTLNILDANQSPTAEATATASVKPTETAQLDGTASSDPENDPLTYRWEQTSGPTVVLSAADQPEASFIAPVLDQDTSSAFRLTVCDRLQQCDSTDVTVTILGVSAYVSPKGDDTTGQGTREKPWKTLGKALETAATYKLTAVFVDEGTFPEDVRMVDGVSVLCGFDSANDWQRSGTVSTLEGGRGVLFADGVTATLDGCRVRLGNSGGVQPSRVAAIRVESASAHLVSCDVDATLALPPDETAGVFVASGRLGIEGGHFVGGNGGEAAAAVAAEGESRVRIEGGKFTGSAETAGPASRTNAGIAAYDDTVLEISGAALSGGAATRSSVGLLLQRRLAKGPALTLERCRVLGGLGFTHVGVDIEGAVSALLHENTIEGGTGSGNRSDRGVGVSCRTSGSLEITGHKLITGTVGIDEVVGVEVDNCPLTLRGNASIVGGEGASLAYGVRVVGSPVTIVDNEVLGAPEKTDSPPQNTIGIRVDQVAQGSTASRILGNQIAGGLGLGTSLGLKLADATGVEVARNTVLGGSAPEQVVAMAVESSSGLSIDANRLEPGPESESLETLGLDLATSTASLTNNVVLGGRGTTSYGVRSTSSTVSAWNNYVSGQGAPGDSRLTRAFGLQVADADLVITHSTWNNNILDTGRTAAHRYAVYEGRSFTPESFRHNDFRPDAEGVLYHLSGGKDLASIDEINELGPTYEKNLSVDPRFADEAAGDFHLQERSLCIDQGLDDKRAPAYDMDRDERPLGAGIDIGPDEVP